jgi:hypothetical protein
MGDRDARFVDLADGDEPIGPAIAGGDLRVLLADRAVADLRGDLGLELLVVLAKLLDLVLQRLGLLPGLLEFLLRGVRLVFRLGRLLLEVIELRGLRFQVRDPGPLH